MSARATLISTIRTPEGLVTLSIREKCAPDFETDKPSELTILTEQDGHYEVVRTPLTWQTERLTETQKHLLTAWESLHSVQNLDRVVSASVHTVQQHTVPELSADWILPPLSWEQTTKPAHFAPTAAHPRAYQGTKHKPPKTKAPDAADLRLYLCDNEGQTRLLSSLNRDNGAPDFTQAASDREAELPRPFRLLLWPSLRHKAEAECERFLALYWELSLDRSPQLLAAIALLVKHQPTANTREWCGTIAQQPAEWRLTFASLLLTSGAYCVEASTLAPPMLPLFWEVQNGPCPVYRLFCLFRSLANGSDCEYMAAGFRLADQVQSDYPFLRVENSGYFPEKALTELLDHLRHSSDYYSRHVLRLWERCGELPGFGQVIEDIAWTNYTPDVAFRYQEMFGRCINGDLSPGERAAKWDCVHGQTGQIDGRLQGIPSDYQMKWVSHLRDLLWSWDTPQELTRNIPAVFLLLERLCRPPYKTMCDTTDVTSDFLAFLFNELMDRFIHAPDTSFQRLEEACRLENNARLIGYGTWVLTPRLPEFTVECFLHYPAKLFKVAKRLGGLPEEMREQVIHEFALSPLMAADLMHQELTDGDAIIQRHRLEGVFNPVPKKLQEYLTGRKALGETQLAMYREQMERQLLLTRLETVERLVLAAMQGAFAVKTDTSDVSHALTVYHSAQENRRALQKYLKAHWGGEGEYLLHHPQTQAWLKKHPQLDVMLWLQGIVLDGENAQHGPLHLAVEQEPLEALKLGTYVGSCLGLGGILTYSAAAVVLDINKQVVYARDARGNVVARQLLAISEDDRLICYSVYPLSTPSDIQSLFVSYDRGLAEALQISLCTGKEEEEYHVETILAHRWWDDYAWNFQIDDVADTESLTRGKRT